MKFVTFAQPFCMGQNSEDVLRQVRVFLWRQMICLLKALVQLKLTSHLTPERTKQTINLLKLIKIR